jgi:diguanylate cyclase (GGDEF)-like protein
MTALAPSADPFVMARLQSWLWAGGAVLAIMIAVIPHPPEANETAFYVAGAASATIAAFLRWRAGRISVRGLQVCAGLGTVLVSACIYFSGERLGASASDIEMLYLWIALYSAYFFSLQAAAVQIASIAVAYWLILAVSSDPSLVGARFAQTVGTLGLATVIVQTLRNRLALVVDRLADAARTDPLTGLRNRRAFEETFTVEVERARRHDRVLTVLVGDLDHFKHVNDRLGHPAGDAALMRAGELLDSAHRRLDTVARTGGEEFALILPETPENEGYLVAENLRSAIEEAFRHDPVPLTVSFGVASFPSHGTTAEALLSASDQALYAAKELGRNRSVIFSDEIATLTGGTSSETHLSTMLALAEALDLRDSGTSDHSQTVGRYSALIARTLGLGLGHVRRIEIAGHLHDIGKIGIADAVLTKAGGLTEEEWEQMRRHPEIGADILGSEYFDDVRSWILAHHEQPDGKGYPHGLQADEIPLEARILAVADAYEAMTADRVYRSSMGSEAARAELLRGAGSQFDRRIVDVFLAALAAERREAETARALTAAREPAL